MVLISKEILILVLTASARIEESQRTENLAGGKEPEVRQPRTSSLPKDEPRGET